MKENEFEDKMYAFGYKLSEHESAEIINEIRDSRSIYGGKLKNK